MGSRRCRRGRSTAKRSRRWPPGSSPRPAAEAAATSRFTELLARPGARSLAAACALGWLSFASYGFAIVLAVEDATGSFAVAGGAVAAFSFASALVAPVRGRQVDRRGPRALVVLAPIHAVGLGLLVVGCVTTETGWLLIVAAGFAGLFTPPLIATARSVWPGVAGPELVTTSHAINAALGDAAMVVGPAVTGAVAVFASPVVALAALIPGVMVAVALLALAARPDAPRTAPPPRSEHRLLGALRESSGLRTLVMCELAVGLWLGALDVGLPLVASESGEAGAAALPFAVFAVGSVAASLAAGSRRMSRTAQWRYVAGASLVAVTLPLTLVSPSLFWVSAVLVAVGVAYGILNVAVFELLDTVVEPYRAVEAWTWLTTWGGLGIAGGAALAGQLAESGPRATFVFLSAAGVCGAAVAVARRSTLDRHAATPAIPQAGPARA